MKVPVKQYLNARLGRAWKKMSARELYDFLYQEKVAGRITKVYFATLSTPSKEIITTDPGGYVWAVEVPAETPRS